jgi:adenine-specific DNA-methyltransferase
LGENDPSKEHSHYSKMDEGGVYYGDNISSPNYRENLIFEYKGYKPPKNGWRYNQEAMARLDREGL